MTSAAPAEPTAAAGAPDAVARLARRLAELPAVLELPADRPRRRPDGAPARLDRVAVPVAPTVAGGPEAVAAAALAALAARLAGRDEVPLAVGGDPRVIVAELGAAADWRSVVERVMAAYDAPPAPLAALVDELVPAPAELDHHPLVQVAVRPADGPAAAGVPLDLALCLGGVAAELEYPTDRFDRTTARRLAARLARLWEAASAAGAGGWRTEALDDRATTWLQLGEWNDTAGSAIDLRPVHEQVAARAALRPGAAAIEDGPLELTYGELDRRANRLAHRLRGLGIGPEEPVALLAPRGAAEMLGALAVLKAGGHYVPIDPGYPAERIRFVLDDGLPAGRSRVLLAVPEIAARHEELLAAERRRGLAVVPLEAGPGAYAGEPESAPEAPVDLAQAAYVIYTSGSTGRPKGVVIPHGALAHMLDWSRRETGAGPDDRWPRVSGPGFDASVWEVWTVLTAGGCLPVPSEELRSAPRDLVAWMREERVTLALLPTPLAQEALAEPAEGWRHLRKLMTGGDRLHRPPHRSLPFALGNFYGPTEVTVVSTGGWIDPGAERMPPIGRPIGHVRAYVVDREARPAPLGVAGELWLAGELVARGYAGRPALTAERFVPDPWSPTPGGRCYRTGDLVRWLAEGNLDFLGRIDQQVKIRGFRIELGEVEEAIKDAGPARDAAVVVREEGRGGRRLVAYAVPADGGALDARALRDRLAERLPDYMVPAAIVVLPALPLTANGKVDRRALPAPPESTAGADGGPPRTATEELVAKTFRERLGVRSVGREESFFDLGGHSLDAARVLYALAEASGVELPVRALFDAPTVAALASRLDARQDGGGPALVPLPPGTPVPLAGGQLRLWVQHRMWPDSPRYSVTLVFDLSGPLDRPALAAAITALVERQAALRTVIDPRGLGDQPALEVRPAGPVALPVVDLGGLDDRRARKEHARLETRCARGLFDLVRGPLHSFRLLALGPGRHRLVTSFHHAVTDGWSMEILVRELAALYRAHRRGERPLDRSLPPLPVGFADFAAWQRRRTAGPELEAGLAHWRHHLAGVPDLLPLPLDRPRPAALSDAGGRVSLALPPDAEAALEPLRRRTGATLFVVLLAAFEALLHRVTGRDDLAVSIAAAGRPVPEVENLIGMFTSTLALRSRTRPAQPFVDLVAAARSATIEGLAHQDVPFDRVVEALAPSRGAGHHPLVQVMFLLQELDAFRAPLDGGAELAAAGGSHPNGTSKLDLTLFVDRRASGLVAQLEYSTELFDRTTIERLARGYRTLVAAIAERPETPVDRLPTMTAGERQAVVVEWADTTVARGPFVPVRRQVAEVAARDPRRPAIDAPDGRLDYGGLTAAADRLAARLQDLGVGREVRVAVLAGRGAHAVVGTLAVLGAGGAYVPADPDYPAARLEMVLEDAFSHQPEGAPRLVLASPAALAGAAGTALAGWRARGGPAVEVLPIELAPADPGERRPADPGTTPGDAAYVIYTSGSTGRPKGVVVEHGTLAELLAWTRDYFRIGAGDRSPWIAAPAFDVSVWEVFSVLTVGAELLVPADEVRLAPAELFRWLIARGATVAYLPTALFDAVLAAAGPDAPAAAAALGLVHTGGDRLRRLGRGDLPGRMMNHYGPTEATVFATAVDLDPVRDLDREPPIGRPRANLRAHVLDAAGRPAGLGVAGELVLSGGLARGYLGRARLTAERFRPDPTGAAGERRYHTGDLVRWLPDGTIGFLGRIDQQVKVRGYRVELGEVETALRRRPEVLDAVVDARGEGAARRLVAYLVPSDPAAPPSPADLGDALARELPAYMVPAVFVSLAALPLNVNGKVDRRALPEPVESGPATAGPPPRTETEKLLAGIWAQVLGVERVGADDDFFLAGGHSLLAMTMISRLNAAAGTDLPLRDLFEARTLAGLARRADRARAAAGPGSPPAAPAPILTRVARRRVRRS